MRDVEGSGVILNWQKPTANIPIGALCLLIVNSKVLPEFFIYKTVKGVPKFSHVNAKWNSMCVLPKDVQAVLLKSDIPGPRWLSKSIKQRVEVDNETLRIASAK